MVKKVGRLTILEPVERPDHVKSGTAYWHCICDCGNSLRVSCDSLQKSLKGKKGAGARSCGCLNRELAAERMIGANNPRWRNDWTEEERKENTAPRRTLEYIKWCKSVYYKDRFTCVACGRYLFRTHTISSLKKP